MTEDPSRRERAGAWLGALTARDVLRLAGLCLLVAVVLPFVVFAVPQVVGAEHSYVVLSASMEPAISPGDVIVVDDVAPESIEDGDVITFGGGPNEPPTTHRVVDVDRADGAPVFTTKGDNNDDPDRATVSGSDLHGRIVSVPIPGIENPLLVFPLIGYVISFGQTTAGFLLLVALPFGLLALDYLREAITDGSSGDGDPEAGESGPGQGAVDSDGVAASAPATDEEGAVVTVGRRTVAIATVGLVGIAAVSGTYGLLEQSATGVTIAVGAVTTGLLTGGTLLRDRSAGSSPADSGANEGGESDLPVVERLPPEVGDWPVVELDSVRALVDAAEGSTGPIVKHAGDGQLYLFGDGVTYTASDADSNATTGDDRSKSGALDGTSGSIGPVPTGPTDPLENGDSQPGGYGADATSEFTGAEGDELDQRCGDRS